MHGPRRPYAAISPALSPPVRMRWGNFIASWPPGDTRVAAARRGLQDQPSPAVIPGAPPPGGSLVPAVLSITGAAGRAVAQRSVGLGVKLRPPGISLFHESQDRFAMRDLFVLFGLPHQASLYSPGCRS